MEFTDLEEKTITRVSRELLRKYRGFVEFDDLRQEMYVWLLSHEEKVNEYRERGRGGEGPLAVSLRRYAARYAMREKAAALGCEMDDFYTYRAGEIELALHDYLLNGVHDQASQVVETSGGQKSKSDPSTGKTQLAVLMDVKTAYEELPVYRQELLADCLLEQDLERVANKYGITKHALYQRKDRALKAMQVFLNDGETR